MKRVHWMMATLMALTLTVAVFGASGANPHHAAHQRQNPSRVAPTTRCNTTVQCTPKWFKTVPGKCPKCGMDLSGNHNRLIAWK